MDSGGVSVLTERLLTSEEWFCSMELISTNLVIEVGTVTTMGNNCMALGLRPHEPCGMKPAVINARGQTEALRGLASQPISAVFASQ
jgi:hypothetical protein